MSIFNQIKVAIGLCLVCATITVGARAQADSDEPAPIEVPRPKQASASRERYLMLTDGKLIKGILSETETECFVEQKIGIMQFPKKRVEGSFDTIRQAYEYRLAQLPERDSDESMKLALWCLNLRLSAEARELLTTILAQNPNHQEARARLLSINQAASRLAHRERDPGVRRTPTGPVASAEDADASRERDPEVRRTEADTTMNAEKPESLNAAVLREAQRALGIRDLPVIFDLPMPLAIKRTEEFKRYVHPLLQAYCAKCHDAQHQGQFQLVTTKARADRTSTALRANLDATLQLVDPQNPAHSVLLSSTLRPHGKGARPRPIFPGSNDKAYMVLARWVNQLVAPKENDDSARPDPSRASVENDEVFAVDRNRSSGARPSKRSSADTKMPSASTSDARSGVRPAIGQRESEPQEFPIPFAISGVKPNPAVPKRSSPAAAKQAAGVNNPTKQPTTKSTTEPPIPPDGDDDLPDDPPPPKTKQKTDASKKTSPKTFTIDPKLLERALQYRNANRQNQN